MSKTDTGISRNTPPMEAHSVSSLPEGDAWCYEPKWDGFRCLAFKDGGGVALMSKSGKPLGRYFPEIVAMLARLQAERFVLDGELLIAAGETYSFSALQMRLHPAESRITRLSQEAPASFVLFDLLMDDKGEVVLHLPFAERRARLERFVSRCADHESLTLSPQTASLQQAHEWLASYGARIDGIVAKPVDARYEPGERVMQKYKALKTADCVVGGFRYGTSSTQVASLLLGLYDDDGKLHHVGFTSGLKGIDKAELTAQLEALIEPPGFTGRAPGGPSRWSSERSGDWQALRPELVAEVRYDHVSDERFRHGTKFLRWRPDKAPRQCTMEQLSGS